MVSNISSKTVFQIGLDSLGSAFHPRKHAERVGDELQESMSFLEVFNLSLGKLKGLLGDNAPMELETLIDEARYSDPVSIPDSEEIEGKLLLSLSALLSSAAEPSSIEPREIREILSELHARNAFIAAKK